MASARKGYVWMVIAGNGCSQAGMTSARKGWSQGWPVQVRGVDRDGQVLGSSVIRGGQCKEGV
jgi:hypothetical protein